MQTPSVSALPLCADPSKKHFHPGWVSYEDTVLDSPDVEVFCGGINEKPTIGAALWRQGHLLHFGFDLAPSQMNETGRALLVDSIAYIARFTQDRAICTTPSAFAGGGSARSSLAHWIKSDDYPVDFVTGAIAPDLLKGVASDRAAMSAWLDQNLAWLHPGPDGRFVFDEDARALELPYDRLESLDAAIAALAPDGPRATHARALLARYVPEGPRENATADRWRAWLAENRAYLIYSEWGGYRWYIDPLAKRRRIPTALLRGAARADVTDAH